ncbi:MAG: hypothetical protein COB98_02970 [Flavobacteriaceae bacterium]|nr:MAG: hypothetical protein COB98_02970 [Flavobacteriaceae bacterium]
MREEKNIDRLFQEKLKDFEVLPPNKSWNFIEQNMVVKSPKKKTAFWMRVTSIAAMLLAFITLGNKYIAPNNFSEIQQFIFKQKDTIKSIVQTGEAKTQTLLKNGTLKLPTKVIPLNAQKQITETELEEFTILEKVRQKQPNVSFTLKDGENLPLNKEISAPEFSKEKRWSIAYNVAPIYFSSFGSSSSPVNHELENNSVSGKSNFSHGIKIAFKLNNKFSVQSGVNLVGVGYTTNNIQLPPGVAIISLTDIAGISRTTSKIPAGSYTKKMEKPGSYPNSHTGSIDQVFGYIEIPLEIKYQITGGKLGVNIVGGFSTLFLNKNELLIEADGFRTSIGEASNLKDINFSGNIGVDVDYLIHKNIYINVSPMLKVQTNTFSKSTGDFQPYYLGIYTGLNFKF